MMKYTPVQGRGFVRPGETGKQQNWGFSGIKKAAPKWSRLSEQITRCAVCVCDPKHKHGDDSRYQAGGQLPCLLGPYCAAIFIRSEREYFFRNSSRTKAHGANLSDSCSSAIFSCSLFVFCDGVSVDSLLVIVCTCKAMRRSTSRYGADSDYSDSWVLRRWSSSRATVTSCPISSAALMPICSTLARASSEDTRGFSPLPSAWRRAISPRTAVTIKFALVSPGCRDASMPLTTSCGNLAFSCCDLLLTELVDMFAPPINNGMQCNTKVNTKKDLKWYSPKCNLNTTRADACNSAIETTKPRTVGAVTGLLTNNVNEEPLWLP